MQKKNVALNVRTFLSCNVNIRAYLHSITTLSYKKNTVTFVFFNKCLIQVKKRKLY